MGCFLAFARLLQGTVKQIVLQDSYGKKKSLDNYKWAGINIDDYVKSL